MVVLPDIQSYSDSSKRRDILFEMTQWIADSRSELNTGLVLQEGDIVFQNATPFGFLSTGNQNGIQQWENARKAFATLDGVLPYILCPGNHDFGVQNADNRNTHFTSYFHVKDNPLNDPANSGILAELGPNASGDLTMENAAYDFTAPDGRHILVIAMEWGPRQAAVDWAYRVASRPEYDGYTKILITHAYLYFDNTRFDWAAKGKSQSNNPHDYSGTNSDTNDGEELWQKLVSPAGFDMVLCGHVGGDMVGYLASTTAKGNTCHQILFNAQFLPEGGQGWLRLLEFLPDGTTVRVRTYSPYFDHDGKADTPAWRTGEEDQFEFTLPPAK